MKVEDVFSILTHIDDVIRLKPGNYGDILVSPDDVVWEEELIQYKDGKIIVHKPRNFKEYERMIGKSNGLAMMYASLTSLYNVKTFDFAPSFEVEGDNVRGRITVSRDNNVWPRLEFTGNVNEITTELEILKRLARSFADDDYLMFECAKRLVKGLQELVGIGDNDTLYVLLDRTHTKDIEVVIRYSNVEIPMKFADYSWTIDADGPTLLLAGIGGCYYYDELNEECIEEDARELLEKVRRVVNTNTKLIIKVLRKYTVIRDNEGKVTVRIWDGYPSLWVKVRKGDDKRVILTKLSDALKVVSVIEKKPIVEMLANEVRVVIKHLDDAVAGKLHLFPEHEFNEVSLKFGNIGLNVDYNVEANTISIYLDRELPEKFVKAISFAIQNNSPIHVENDRVSTEWFSATIIGDKLWLRRVVVDRQGETLRKLREFSKATGFEIDPKEFNKLTVPEIELLSGKERKVIEVDEIVKYTYDGCSMEIDGKVEGVRINITTDSKVCPEKVVVVIPSDALTMARTSAMLRGRRVLLEVHNGEVSLKTINEDGEKIVYKSPALVITEL